MNLEQMILSNLLFYNDARHFLPQINKNWFVDNFSRRIMEVMTTLYYENKPVDMVTLSQHFTRKEVFEIVNIQQEASGLTNIKTHLRTLEYNYIKRTLVDRLIFRNT